MEQFSAHEEEELTEARVSREGQPIVPSSRYEDPFHYEDPVMHISLYMMGGYVTEGVGRKVTI